MNTQEYVEALAKITDPEERRRFKSHHFSLLYGASDIIAEIVRQAKLSEEEAVHMLADVAPESPPVRAFALPTIRIESDKDRRYRQQQKAIWTGRRR